MCCRDPIHGGSGAQGGETDLCTRLLGSEFQLQLADIINNMKKKFYGILRKQWGGGLFIGV